MKLHELVEISGVPQRQIINWLDKSIISYSIMPEKHLTRREYDMESLAEVLFIKKLFKAGFSIEAIKKILPAIMKRHKKLHAFNSIVVMLEEFIELRIDHRDIVEIIKSRTR